MSIRFLAISLWLFTFLSCKENAKEIPQTNEQKKDSLAYNEKFRPQFHFSPPAHWMNDPNGLVYNDGFYHLFYQYYPDDIVWGPMHWGHARSTDLLHWDNREVALYPDSLGYIFSGSAVVDKNNSSGFGSEDHPPLVAMFTYHDAEGAKANRNDYQTQGIAYSTDNGETWTKYEGNPVVKNPGMIDFRDPKVFWHEELKKWILILVGGDHAIFYQSDNLKEWKETGTFGKNSGAHGGVWECPDLFKLPVENGEGEKWVLFISINPGGPNQGSATQYFIGDFDGNTFKPEHVDERWLDYGRDNYAGITFNNTPNGDRLFIGWMSNWLYGQEVPTETWRSAMTVPRQLSLEKVGDNVYLRNKPIDGFSSLVGKTLLETEQNVDSVVQVQRSEFEGLKISFDMSLKSNSEMELGNGKERFKFGFNSEAQQFYVDRASSGLMEFSDKFAGPTILAPRITEKEDVNVTMLVDRASVEIFIDNGLVVLTNIVFPEEQYNKLFFPTTQQLFKNLKVSTLKSIWNEE